MKAALVLGEWSSYGAKSAGRQALRQSRCSFFSTTADKDLLTLLSSTMTCCRNRDANTSRSTFTDERRKAFTARMLYVLLDFFHCQQQTILHISRP
jgi:hypothetical protein